MRVGGFTIALLALLVVAPTASLADLASYDQDFEALAPAPQALPDTSLGDDGWLLFVNGFDAFGGYLFGYGPFAAPNHGEAVSAVITGEGGADQGDKQLSVFSNYFDPVHGNCDPPGDTSSPTCIFLETNVFQEQVIGAADVGNTWVFEFDAKRGNIEGVTTALGFIKTLHPVFFFLSSFITVDMTGVPDEWGSYSISIFIDPALEGHILQFGFLNTATAFEGSGVLYDNVSFGLAPLDVAFDVKPGSCPNPVNIRSRGVLPVALLGTADFDVTAIDTDSIVIERADGVGGSVSILDGPPGPGPVFEDTSTALDSDGTCGCHGAMGDGFVDLRAFFSSSALTSMLDLSSALAGQSVELVVSGQLMDGTEFEGTDCVVVVPVGGANAPSSSVPTSPDGDSFELGEAGGETYQTSTDPEVEPEADRRRTTRDSRRQRNDLDSGR